jgi:hypothetical protein
MMQTKWMRRSAVVLAAVLASPLAVSHAAGPRQALPEAREISPWAITPGQVLLDAAARRPDAKIDTILAEKVRNAAPDAREFVIVASATRLDLSSYGQQVLHQWGWPAGEQLALLKVSPKVVASLAALPGVASVESGDPTLKRAVPDESPDLSVARRFKPASGLALRELQAALKQAPTWAETQQLLSSQATTGSGRGMGPAGWHDVADGHGAREAWQMGFKGSGVRVAVLDSSVDFAHPDMQGTVAVNPTSSPYAGWAQIYDPYANYNYMLESTNPDPTAPKASQLGVGGFVQLYQSAAVKADGTACFKPLTGDYNPFTGQIDNPRLAPENCAVKVPPSKSNTVRYGHHPDAALFTLGARADRAGELAGVLLVDAHTAGQYDTVYVDLNFNNDFTDEKPTTRDDPVSWRDITNDAVADLSGGTIYFIADGKLKFPGQYLWEDFPESGLTAPLPTPAAGEWVAIHYDDLGHGTLCASNVVSQGRLGVPPGSPPQFRNQEQSPLLNANGRPDAMNPGMAPEAKLVAVGSVYNGPRALVFGSAWRYVVLGTDPARPDDDVQVSSNSYGFSDVDNDGWDGDSRTMDYYVRKYNTNLITLAATGNGGPGYGTITPPKATTAMGVAAATQFGSTGWDSLYEVSQITYGDIGSFSDRGPLSNGTNGPSVAADGAFAAGGNPINFVTVGGDPEGRGNGAFANVTWAGTSRSSPVAAGLMALTYEAFKASQNRWPTAEEAKSIFMAGARFAGYETTVMGAGVADAGDAARIASGQHGVYAIPSQWAPGDYRGSTAPAFTHLVKPGASSTGTFTLNNPSDHAIDVTVQGQWNRRIGSYDIPFSSKPVAQESTPYAMQAVDYMIPIDKAKIPTGTDLMVVRMVQPYNQFDLNNNVALNVGDNLWNVGVFQHTDWDDDTKLWDDKNGDGIVQHTLVKPTKYIDLDHTLAGVDYANSELDEGEYARMNFTFSVANNWAVPVHHPLERWKHGLHIGLWHVQAGCDYAAQTCSGLRPAAVPVTNLTLRVDFYDYMDWPWLRLSKRTVSVPAEGQATFDVTMAVPADAPAGFYEGAIFADYARQGQGSPTGVYLPVLLQNHDLHPLPSMPAAARSGVESTDAAQRLAPAAVGVSAVADKPVPAGGGYELAGHRLTIPVSLNVGVAYDWNGAVTLGGERANDMDAPYNPGAVRGTFNWSWRPESGDWRFHFVDTTTPTDGTYLITKTTWDDATDFKTDIDTRVFQQAKDRFSDPSDPANTTISWADPAWYGPSTMELLMRSPYKVMGSARWPFDVSSDVGANEDWLSTPAPASGGLTEVMLHNVLFSGSKIEVPFETTVSSLKVDDVEVDVVGSECGMLNFTSQIDLSSFTAEAIGFGKPLDLKQQPIGQDPPTDPPSAASFKQDLNVTSTAARFHIKVTGKADEDLDLYVLYDGNSDGQFNPANEIFARSADSDANEEIDLPGFTSAGKYQVWVVGFRINGTTSTFDYLQDVVFGESLTLDGAPQDVAAGTATSLEVCVDASTLDPNEQGPLNGIVIFGPDGAPGLVRVDVKWVKSAAAAAARPIGSLLEPIRGQ